MPQAHALQLDAPFFQAGLAGYSDAAMRLVARRHGCPFCVTEAMLDQFLIAGGKGLAAAELDDADHPIAGQLMGSHPAEIAQGAKILVQLGYDVIDVNLACPVKKIKKKARGGHLMQVPDEAAAILDAVKQAVGDDRPCTVKLRRGSDDSAEATANFHRIFAAAIDLGYAGAVVHGRTVEQKYLGPSRWAFLRELVANYREVTDRFFIGGSGDIWSAADIFRMIDETGVQLVSVARGCIGNPWLFEQARALMRGDRDAGRRSPTLAQQRQVLREHFELSVALHGEKKAGMMMRKFGIKFSRHHPDGETVRQAFITVKSLADWEAVLARHYAGDGPGVAVELAQPDEAEHATCDEPVGAAGVG
ncbi:MAG: tRNA-dihydrouridine synthase family protein [Phycisphaeraceae bacterium]